MQQFMINSSSTTYLTAAINQLGCASVAWHKPGPCIICMPVNTQGTLHDLMLY